MENDYLIVVGNEPLASNLGLQALARDRSVVAETDRYTVFALRGRLDAAG